MKDYKKYLLNNIEWLNDYSVKYKNFIITNKGQIWNINKKKWINLHFTKKDISIYLPNKNNYYCKISIKNLIKWIFNLETITIKYKNKNIKIEKESKNNFKFGDIVYFKNYLLNDEPKKHPYLIISVNKKQFRDWKYTLISLSSNIGSSINSLSPKIRKLTNSLIIIKPNEAIGLWKESMVRLTPTNCIKNVPHKELSYGGKIKSQSKISRTKNIYNQVLEKKTKDWCNIKKLKKLESEK